SVTGTSRGKSLGPYALRCGMPNRVMLGWRKRTEEPIVTDGSAWQRPGQGEQAGGGWSVPGSPAPSSPAVAPTPNVRPPAAPARGPAFMPPPPPPPPPPHRGATWITPQPPQPPQPALR